MNNKKEINQDIEKPLPRNAYESLFIPKKRAYENLFAGGPLEKLSEGEQHFCIYSNYEETEEIENENKLK
ncbi:MAG: hypothetical protein ACRCXT_19765 [Paraclostridium sp.]